MNLPNLRWTLPRSSAALAAFAAIAAVVVPPAGADDRDVLRDAAGKPYLFFLLDNSGSMNLRPPCDEDDIEDGKCEQADFCEDDAGCRLPLEGDDPKSKFRIAREALYEVLADIDDIDFGFAVMDQNSLHVKNKHWLYQVDSTQSVGFFTLSGGVAFPTAGSYETFGATLTCPGGTGDENIACMPTVGGCGNGQAARCAPADTDNSWEIERFRRLPRLGTDGETATVLYLRVPDGTRYRVTYDSPGSPPTPVAYADTGSITVEIEIAPCVSDDCTSVDNGARVTKELTYTAVGSYLIHDPTIDRNGSATEVGWLGYSDAAATSDCDWEGNLDATADAYNGYSLTWPDPEPTDTLDPRVDPDRYISCYPEEESEPTADDVFPIGDSLPFDWTDSNLDEILDHLASQRYPVADLNPDDDFGVASYFNDTRQSGDDFLRYRSEADRVMIPVGTPSLGHSIKSFRGWYGGCRNDTPSCAQVGWSDIAAICDPTWACRQVFLVILTDGDIQDDVGGQQNPCASGENQPNACSETAGMRAQYGIETYVLAFGRENQSQNVLNCLAANSHTQDPIYPKNKQDLINILNEIIGRVREEASAFASAAVPQVQANATDKIFLSSFTPLNDTAYWAGRLDAFLKPLPILPGGEPDRSVVCDSDTQSQCFLWDAGDVQGGHLGGDGTYSPERLLLQAPHPDDLAAAPPWDPDDLQLGTGVDERRVVYSYFPGDGTSGNRRMFTYPGDAETAAKYDLWDAMGISYIVGDTDSEAAANDEANAVIATTLVEKEATIDVVDPNDPDVTLQLPITYLMGDLFHADPVVFSRPSNFVFYTSDPYLNKPLCGAAADPNRDPPPSYRWFADRNFCRRSLLVAASNDGQLHVFDGGTFESIPGVSDVECLLPAKDLDGDGDAETDEFADSVTVDYDLNDNVEGFKTCSDDGDCGTGPCEGGVCRDVEVGIIDGAYNNGSGREVFAFIPRAMLKTVHWMANGADRNFDFWGMDASPRVDDVFIDPLASESGSATCLNREWRSVLIGGYREGGPGLYALDMTQPDTLAADHVPEPAGTPAYVPTCFASPAPAGCSRPYPSILWEFQDEAVIDTGGGTFVTTKLDEDLNDVSDLANSWSRVATGRIRICTADCDSVDPANPPEAEDRFVAVFGGGVGDTPSIANGNFLYMVDIETGQTIYKQEVVGAVPADVAAIDSNADGYLDRLYAGTTAGFVYKVILEASASSPMRLVSQTVQTRIGGSNFNHTVTRLQGPAGDTNRYRPFQVFSTGGKPIYHEISAVFVASQNRVAMAFGTGNRWNLWDANGQEGRFYVVLDDNYTDPDHDGFVDVTCAGCTEPLTEASFIAIDPQAAFDPSTAINYLFEGAGGNTLRGWYYTLDANEKVITEAFSLAGVTIFTSFVPTEVANSDGTCSRAGTSRIFIVGTVTAIGYAIPPGGTIADRARYTEISQFTTPPFVEQSATANPESGGNTQHADFVTDSLAIIRDELKTLQSARCRYANYTQNIKTIRSDTGVVFVAPIPLCLDPTSWKEF